MTDIQSLLTSLPSSWRDQIVAAIAAAVANKKVADCDAVKQCEVVTTLSDFTVNGTTVSISYTDENEVTYDRSFDLSLMLNSLLDGIDPACVATPTEWSNMTWAQRMGAIVAYTDNCCSTTTTTTAP